MKGRKRVVVSLLSFLTALALGKTGVAGTPADVQSYLKRADYEYCENLGVDPLVPIAIAGVESDWTPFVVKVNTRKRIIVQGQGIKKIGYNTFKCSNAEICTTLAKIIIGKGFKNVDLGAFQFNYYHQRKVDPHFQVAEAFDVRKAYRRVCRIVAKNFKYMGRTANAVALYHSARPERNYRYAKRFWKIYNELKRRK